MALPKSGDDREFKNFGERTLDAPSGLSETTHRFVFDETTHAKLDLLIASQPPPSGLTTAGRMTEVTITSTGWTLLPPSPLSGRNAINIQNINSVAIRLNYDPTEPGFVGWFIGPNSENFRDIRNGIPIYAKSASGSIDITVEELA